ncbi:MAG: patatin-like phospholipase family protein [Candidatus Binataceae bacterium]
MMKGWNSYQTAIVLQGGGALGAYEYGVLKALYEKRPGFIPAVVTGVSIGAITAAVLVGAKSDPIEALGEIWGSYFSLFGALPPIVREYSESFTPRDAQQALSALGNHGMYAVRPDYVLSPGCSDSIFSLAPLKATLAKVIDIGKLNGSKTHLAVGAIDIASGESQYFDNHSHGGLSLDHIIASGSLPPAFPPATIDGHPNRRYWDGGLFLNTPLSEAINFLEQCGADNPNTLRELLVVELFPMKGHIPHDMAGVWNRLSQLMFTSKLNLDTALFGKMNSFIDLMDQIDALATQYQPNLRNHPGYIELRKHQKVDAFNIIQSALPPQWSNAGDFSKAAIEHRIGAGYRAALEHNIGSPKAVTVKISTQQSAALAVNE